jgi:hypothetical protein
MAAGTGGAAVGASGASTSGGGASAGASGAPGSSGTSATAGVAAGGFPTQAGAGGGGGAGAGQGGAGGQAQGGQAQGGSGSGGVGGGSAGSGGGGAGGGGGYEPCPTDDTPCLILPFGDSITFGYNSSDGGGYRSPLFKLIVEGNKNATFVGSQMNGPGQVAGRMFPKNHEGHSGWTIDSGYVSFGDGISTLVPKPAFNTVPHIVLLMIGTNDVGASMGTDKIADRLDKLLDKIVAAAPQALVVVAELTPIGYNPAPLAPYNAKIPGIVQARVAKGQHFAVVDMSKMPKNDLQGDDLHPNDAGYAYMADIWYAAIKGVLR